MRAFHLSFFLLVASACFATRAATQNGASNLELYASYCTGVLGVAIDSATSAPDNTPPLDASPQDVLRWATTRDAGPAAPPVATGAKLADAKKRVKRFTAYLDATGVFVDLDRPKAVAGLESALQAGAAESSQCYATRLRCALSYSAKFTDTQPTPPALFRQLRSCMSDEPACPRARRCFARDALPG